MTLRPVLLLLALALVGQPSDADAHRPRLRRSNSYADPYGYATPGTLTVRWQSLLYDGQDQSSGSVAPWDNFTGYVALADCGSGQMISVARRSISNSLSLATSSLRINRTLTGGEGWLYNRTNELELEDDAATDPYSPALLTRASGHLVLTAEPNLVATGYIADYAGWTSSDCGATWSAKTTFPRVGTRRTTAGGPCVELPWGTGTCPGDGCALYCPAYYQDCVSGSPPCTGETRQTSFGYLCANGTLASCTRRANIARAATSAGPAYQTPQVVRLTGDGYCGTYTSTSCLYAQLQDTVTNQGGGAGTVWKTYSRDWGLTWETVVVAFAGSRWPSVQQDPTSKLLLSVAGTAPAAGAGNGRTLLRTSIDRGQNWSSPTEIGDTSFATGSGSSYFNGQVAFTADRHAKIAFPQFGTEMRWTLADAWWNYDATTDDALPFQSTRSWTQAGASAVYATTATTVTAFRGATRLTCGFWFRNDTATQTEDILRNGDASGVVQQSFYVRRNNTNPHWEVAIPAARNTNEMIISANNTQVIDTWQAVLFVFDGAGVGNSGRLQLGADDTDLTAGATYSGTIPAAMTIPNGEVLRLGAGASAANYMRTSLLDHVPCWINAHGATSAQYATARTAWYNSGRPGNPTTIAAAWGAGQPDVFFALDGSMVNSGSLNIGSIVTTGTPLYSDARLRGPGYRAP